MKAADLGMGSAVNADQAILMTLDTSEIFDTGFLETHFYAAAALERRSLIRRLQKRLKTSLIPKAVFTEMEFEFERNIESSLAHCLKNAANQTEIERLENFQQAFLADVKAVSSIVADTIAKIGIKTAPGTESKFQQARKVIFAGQ